MKKIQKKSKKQSKYFKKQTHFKVELTSFDAKSKLKIIKEVKNILKLGLKESKELVEKLPATLKDDVSKVDSEQLKEQLEKLGAVITLK